MMAMGLIAALSFANAQKKNFSYNFYGQVRGDLFYNSRANSEIVDGLFHLYPADIKPDADGCDLNAKSNGSFYMLYSRLGLDAKGPVLPMKNGKIITSAKLELDFRGSGSNWSILRMRHGYVNFDFVKKHNTSSLLVGQTWHPLFGDVYPMMLNLSTGAPFNPFSRSPQIRYRFATDKGLRLTAAAMWQLQYLSTGPNGKSEEYIKNSNVPEFYVSAEYGKNKFLGGAGVEILSLTPRTQSTVGDKTYKVSERITTASFEAHAKYKTDNWQISGKTTLASNLTQTCGLGGYAVSGIYAHTGEQEYTPIRISQSWINIVYGKKWQYGFFAGYLKNLGTRREIVGAAYGIGLDVDQVFTTNYQISYNLPFLKVGMEYSPSTACFGTMKTDGRVYDTHSVTNHRLVTSIIYYF
jgi:hypothetical protein